MPSPVETQKQGGCYIFLISCLFICTFSGAVFLVLYMIQPDSAATPWYPFIGVALVCLPWFFWLLTFLYRILSRTFGFRMICFGSSANNRPAPAAAAADGGGGGGGGDLGGNKTGNGVAEERLPTVSPRRVHFGDTVVLGEDDGGASRNKELSRSSSSSSSLSRQSNESELPLKLSVAS